MAAESMQLDATVERLPAINYSSLVIPHGYLRLRRVIEVLAIILLSPLLLLVGLIVACLVALESKGGIFFLQPRPGKNGKVFKMVKFRTMYQHSSQDQLAVEHDERITAVGAYLRKYRLDEIPQCWNVLKGEMSLIGPRPAPYNFYKIYLEQLPGYATRQLVRPGITGWAQMKLGYTTTLQGEELKLQYDLFYLANISPKTDLLVVWGTIRNIVKGLK